MSNKPLAKPPPKPTMSIARVCYRQLLRWCRWIDATIPPISTTTTTTTASVSANTNTIMNTQPLGGLRIPAIYLQTPVDMNVTRWQAMIMAPRNNTMEHKEEEEEKDKIDPSLDRARALLQEFMDQSQSQSQLSRQLPSTPKVIAEPKSLTVRVETVRDVQQFVKLIFRINHHYHHHSPQSNPSPTNDKERDSNHDHDQHSKARIQAAFEALQSVNTLTPLLQARQEKRKQHIDYFKHHHHHELHRNNFVVRIGQVVQHKVERWRGVVSGWDYEYEDRINDNTMYYDFNDSSNTKTTTPGSTNHTSATSLTHKSYYTDISTTNTTATTTSAAHFHDHESPSEKNVNDIINDLIRVQVMVDVGDAQLRGLKSPPSTSSSAASFHSSSTTTKSSSSSSSLFVQTVKASDLVSVRDPDLLRIQSPFLIGSSSPHHPQFGEALAQPHDDGHAQQGHTHPQVQVHPHAQLPPFVRFDTATGAFVPNAQLQFEYPYDCNAHDDHDAYEKDDAPSSSSSSNALSLYQGIRQGCHAWVESVLQCVEYSPQQHQPQHPLLDEILEELQQIRTMTMASELDHDHDHNPPIDSDSTIYNSIRAMRSWLELIWHVSHLMTCRHEAQEHQHRIRFKLGDWVQHRVFGFRGIVAGWDPYPTMDVSRWDGLQQLQHPELQPFYHIIPVQQDCVEVFGGMRPPRYVCQDNLDPWRQPLSSLSSSSLEPPAPRVDPIDLSEWTVRDPSSSSNNHHHHNSNMVQYIPSDALRFQYAEDLRNVAATTDAATATDVHDDNPTTPRDSDFTFLVRCMTQIEEAMTRCMVESRMQQQQHEHSQQPTTDYDERRTSGLPHLPMQPNNASSTPNTTFTSSPSPLPLSQVLRLLAQADNAADAWVIQEFVKEIRKSHTHMPLRRQLEKAMTELMRGHGEKALQLYQSIVAELELYNSKDKKEALPYPEAYHQMATCVYLMGQMEEAVTATRHALALDRAHGPAWNGLGLWYCTDTDHRSNNENNNNNNNDNGDAAVDFATAIACFRESLRIDPWSPVSARLSQCLDRLHQQQEQQQEPKPKQQASNSSPSVHYD